MRNVLRVGLPGVRRLRSGASSRWAGENTGFVWLVKEKGLELGQERWEGLKKKRKKR